MYDMLIDTNVAAEMRDGTILRADVYRPRGEGPWPVLLTRIPYGKNTQLMTGALDVPHLVQNGFIVVVQDVRGRFASDGEHEPWTFEPDDGYDTVQWASKLPASNGSVGMFGISYMGNTQWTAALSKAPALKAISPGMTFAEPDDGLFLRGGARELGLAVSWSLFQGADVVSRRYADDPAQLGAAMGVLLGDVDETVSRVYWEVPTDALSVIVRNGIPDIGYERSLREPGWVDCARVAGRQADVDVPVLNYGGWFDAFSQGPLDSHTALQNAGRPTHLLMGPWSHTNIGHQQGSVNFGIASNAEVVGFRGRLTDIQSKWFHRWLDTDQPDDVDGLPPVLLFVMGIDQWREEQEWPLARAIDTPIYLHAGGALSFDAPLDGDGSDEYVYDPADPVPTTGGAVFMATEFPAGPLNQASVEARPDVLVFTSEALDEPLEVTGRVTATIFAESESESESADWVVRLCDVDADGISRNIVDGIVRTSSNSGEHTVDLWSTSHVFLKGHRIRVHVTSSNFPRWDRNPAAFGTGGVAGAPIRHTVHHDAHGPSRLTLPVIPAN